MIRFILKDSAGVFKTFDMQHPALECALFNKLNKHEVIGMERVDKEHTISLLPTEVLPDGKMGIKVGFATGGMVDTRQHGNTIPASNLVGGTIHTEPQFPEKYTPVIARDADVEVWRPRLLVGANNRVLGFDTPHLSYNQIAPLAGNEYLIATSKKPPFYWTTESGKIKLIKA